MAIHWSILLASGLASFVEFVEALTIVLAVGAIRGWKSAFSGAIAAAIVLAIVVLIFGPSLSTFDGSLFKIIIGGLLLLFGLRWLRKAILRGAGVLKLHDEADAYDKEVKILEQAPKAQGFDFGASLVAFNGVFIEGVEVIFIVLAVGGARKEIGQAALGATIAAILVIGLGIIARKPLTMIPENLLKFAVGCLVSSFGSLWVGEGLSVKWAGGDFSLLALTCFYLLIGIVGVFLVRSIREKSTNEARSVN